VTPSRVLEDLCGHDVHRCKQVGRPVALVAMGRPGSALGHRQGGLGPVARLDLGLTVEAEDDGPLWRVPVKADDVDDVSSRNEDRWTPSRRRSFTASGDGGLRSAPRCPCRSRTVWPRCACSSASSRPQEAPPRWPGPLRRPSPLQARTYDLCPERSSRRQRQSTSTRLSIPCLGERRSAGVNAGPKLRGNRRSKTARSVWI